MAEGTFYPLITLMLMSPLVGIDNKRVLHGIEMGPVAGSVWKKRKTLDAACGKRVRFWAVAGAPVQWPTQAALPGDYERCRECWVATGKKRPMVTIKNGAE